MVAVVSNAYDLIYPSPIPLEDFSSIVLAIKLWRSNLIKHRVSNTLENVYFSNFNSNQIPDLFWVVKPKIEVYFNKLVSSMTDWLRFHFEYVFKFHRDSVSDILNEFNDIVCDYDGSIHYVRTAEKMLYSDRISKDEKFLIACLYSFEDSIREIWPSIEENFEERLSHIKRSDKDKINVIRPNFDSYPQLYYWTHRLRNTMDQIPNPDGVPVDGLMLCNTENECLSSFEYFWNRVSCEIRYQTVLRMYKSTSSELRFCVRFLLLKLNEQQLTNFITMEGVNLMCRMCVSCDEKYVLQVWMQIRDKMDETSFIRLINELLSENNFRLNNENSVTCCKIWKSAANDLKQSATKKNLLDQSLFKKLWQDLSYLSKPREVEFLIQVLKDVTLEQRGIFWRNNWPNLFASTRPVDLQQIMLLCFSNETEIDEFKHDTMARYENLVEMAITFFRRGYFAEWANLLQFCCPDKQKNTDLKRRCLQYNFLVKGSMLNSTNVKNPKPLQEFIDNAYSDNIELASDFRYQLLSSSKTIDFLIDYLILGSKGAIEFVKSFALTNLKLEQWKKLFVDSVRRLMIRGGSCRLLEQRGISQVVLWCLGSNDELSRFKFSIESLQ